MSASISDFRPALPGDAAAIAALNVRSWRAAYPGLLPDAVLDALEPHTRAGRWRERIAGGESHGQVLVTEGEEGLHGFAWFGAARAHHLRPPPPMSGEIMAFYLDPDHFGGGLADRLAAPVESWLGARFPCSFLWVLEGNARARAFYTRRGWLADGCRAPYPRPGCQGVFVVRHSWAPRVGG